MFTVLTWWLRVIARVHAVHAINAEQRQLPTFGLSQLAWAIGPPVGSYETTSTIAIYAYSARKLILILPPHRG